MFLLRMRALEAELRAHMGATLAIKPPRQAGRLGNSDPVCLDNPGSGCRSQQGQEFSPKTIQPVAGPVHPEGLGELAGAGAQLREGLLVPPSAHSLGSARRLKCADEDKTLLGATLHEEVQKPVNLVVLPVNFPPG